MFISVVVATFNAGRYLEACLDALAAQDHPARGFEVLLVDNGSTDGSLAVARRFPGVRLLEERTPGAYAARNHGVQAARGDVIAFTDPDCVADRSWIGEIARAMADPGVEVLCGRRRPPPGSKLLESLFDYENAKDEFVLGGADPDLYYGYCNDMAVRRRLFESAGPFLLRARGADTLFVRKVALERPPGAIRYLPSARVTHLEVSGPGVYYKKVFLYGRHRRRNNRILRSRPLRLAERLAVYRRAVRAGAYSTPRAAVLLAALVLGALAWSVGSASGGVGLGWGPRPWFRRLARQAR